MAVENIELYEFLKERECHLFRENDEMQAWVVVPFYLLSDFVKVVGNTYFDEGGMDIKMFEDYLAIDLNYIFEAECEFIYEYRKCFEEDEFKKYESVLFDIFQTSK